MSMFETNESQIECVRLDAADYRTGGIVSTVLEGTDIPTEQNELQRKVHMSTTTEHSIDVIIQCPGSESDRCSGCLASFNNGGAMAIRQMIKLQDEQLTDL